MRFPRKDSRIEPLNRPGLLPLLLSSGGEGWAEEAAPPAFVAPRSVAASLRRLWMVNLVSSNLVAAPLC